VVASAMEVPTSGKLSPHWWGRSLGGGEVTAQAATVRTLSRVSSPHQ